MNNTAKAWTLAAGLWAVAGVSQAQTIEEPLSYPDVEVLLNELGDSFLRIGQYVQAATIVQVTPGESAERVTRLLGTPVQVARHSDTQEWHYNINLPLADGNNQLVCQYRVGIAPNLTVTDTQWRRHQCQVAFNEFTQSLQLMSFASDVLFGFDSAEIGPEGNRLLAEVALVLSNQYRNPEIQITGHTDRIGRAQYNQNLSEQRAQAVSTYLTSHGVPAGWMTVEGRGASDPVVTCLGTQVTQELKDCLSPNRRVGIEIAERHRE